MLLNGMGKDAICVSRSGCCATASVPIASTSRSGNASCHYQQLYMVQALVCQYHCSTRACSQTERWGVSTWSCVESSISHCKNQMCGDVLSVSSSVQAYRILRAIFVGILLMQQWVQKVAMAVAATSQTAQPGVRKWAQRRNIEERRAAGGELDELVVATARMVSANERTGRQLSAMAMRTLFCLWAVGDSTAGGGHSGRGTGWRHE